MTTTVTHRLPVEEINARAQQIEFGRTLLTILAAVFFAVGWLIGKTFTVVWLAVVWSAVAVKVGWQEARKPMASGP